MKRSFVVLVVVLLLALTGFSDIKKGGEAVVGLTTIKAQENYNPFSPNCQYFLKGGILFEPLLFINDMAGTEEPWLAESYEWADGNKSLTFTLRNDVKWSDGSNFTAEDVVFTFNLIKEFPGLDLTGIWKGSLKEVIAQGEYEVEFVFNEVDVPAYSNIAGKIAIVPKKYWENVEDPITFLNPEGIGTGPFFVEKVDEGAQVYILARNPYYWNGEKPYIDKIKLRIFQSNDANNLSLLKGEIDWASSFMPDVEKIYVSKNPEVNLAWSPSGSPVSIYPNLTKSPLNNAAFRKAVSMALNKKKIADVAEYGYTPPAHPSGMKVGFLEEWFDKSLEEYVYSYDVEGAKSLLKEAGFELNKDGKLVNPETNDPVKIDLMVVTGWTDWITTAKFVAKDLKEIGVEVNVAPVSYGQYTQAITSGMFDMALGGPDGGSNPYYAYNIMLNSSLSAPVGEKANSNYIRWMNAETDNALNLFKGTSDSETQKEAINVIVKQMLTEVPVIPMFYTPIVEEFSARRFVGWPSEEDPYVNAAPWAMPTPGVIMQNIHLK
ncbi:MAG TPA: ABC transporter substrate-binding protein [Thermotogota bacterium]|nr:ABC transporter substrate-binding protein [Thermotogota bacterium]HPJ90023.1 ABC transporter substrate-binding protein [Thermotogota bacterium]HPR95546.1 ABC transporter substrate-binding protein [Thermotogota bacterium]